MTEHNTTKKTGTEYMKVRKGEWINRESSVVDGAEYFTDKEETIKAADDDELIIQVKYTVLGRIGRALRPANLKQTNNDEADDE